MDLWEAIGAGGVLLSAIAYVPQLVHLAKEHCSAGVSLIAWTLWALAALCLGTKALRSGDVVFIAMVSTSFVASAAILGLGWKYRGQRCPAHKEWSGAQRIGRAKP